MSLGRFYNSSAVFKNEDSTQILFTEKILFCLIVALIGHYAMELRTVQRPFDMHPLEQLLAYGKSIA